MITSRATAITPDYVQHKCSNPCSCCGLALAATDLIALLRLMSSLSAQVLAAEENTNRGKSVVERGSSLRVDDSIVTTTRARDESERVMAEVLAGVIGRCCCGGRQGSGEHFFIHVSYIVLF